MNSNEELPSGQMPMLERIECEAWASLCAAAPDPIAHGLGLEMHRMGEALQTVCARVDQGQFNRLFGLGQASDDGDNIAPALARFRAAGVHNAFVQIPPGHSAFEDAATREGLVPYKRPWVKFHRSAADLPSADGELVIEEAVSEHAADFGAVIVAGFGMPGVLSDWLAALCGAPGWHCYLAKRAGNAIAGAALYVSGTVAWCGVGATRPEARKRGAQTALLARRISDAARFGASDVVTETGLPLPGEFNPSHANILRAGFRPVYNRANWVLPS